MTGRNLKSEVCTWLGDNDYNLSLCYIPLGGSSVTYVDVNKSEIAGYKLAIVGCYAEAVDVFSDTTWLENGNDHTILMSIQ